MSAGGPLGVAILISGRGSNMVALADSMTGDHPARPVLVVSSDPAAGGLDLARARGIETLALDRRALGRAAFEDALLGALEAASADLVCLAGFMWVLSPRVVGAHPGRILNIHPSLLPRHPGLDTHARAIAAGDRWHGCSVHEVTAELDAGPVLGRARLPVREGETAEALEARVRAREHVLYPAVLRRVASGDRTLIEM